MNREIRTTPLQQLDFTDDDVEHAEGIAALYRGVVSFWEDPAVDVEAACADSETPAVAESLTVDPVEAITEGRTIWNSDGTDGPCLICPPARNEAAS